MASIYRSAISGTLPLAWEKVYWFLPLLYWLGITPTRVGKRLSFHARTALTRDHSHSRGKKTQCLQAKPSIQQNFIIRFFTNFFLLFFITCQDFFQCHWFIIPQHTANIKSLCWWAVFVSLQFFF